MVLYFGFMTKAVLITKHFLAIAEQCLQAIEIFPVDLSALLSGPQENRYGVAKRLGGDAAGIADLN